MLKKVPKLIFAFGIIYYLFHFFFFWVFESTDSYFYWAFADFLKTGRYFAPFPYFYTVPSTMEPPLYSVFLYLAQLMPRADIIIHLVQVLTIVISSILLFKIFTKYTKSEIALLLAATFLLAPAHTIYVSNLVAEPIAAFFIVSYVYIVHLILNKKKENLAGPLLLLSAVATLQRYNLLIYYLLALILILVLRIKVKKFYLWTAGSLAVIMIWVFINHSLNGSWGMSNAEGKHLYNRIFHFGRMLPPENDPSFVKFKGIVGPPRVDSSPRVEAGDNIDYFKPWWFYEPQLVKAVGSETKSNELMQEVSIAAFKNNPVKYFADTIPFFFFAHDTNPTYHDPLYIYSGKMKDNCRTLGNIVFCAPIIPAKFAIRLWDRIAGAVDFYYLNISKFVNFLLLLPAIILALVKKDKFMRYSAVLYLSSILFFVSTEAAIPRYTYIFTPIKTILIGNLIIMLIKYRVKKA